MVYDVCLKIKDLGCIYGSFVKLTPKCIHLSNAVLTKSSGVSISYMKIEKKHVIMVTRMATPSFESFTDEQLQRVMELNVLEYTQAVQRILESRRKTAIEPKQTPKTKSESKKPSPQEKKDWDQFETNKKLFGVEPKFNVDEYACDIDRSAPEYPSIEAHAQKIVKGLSYEGGHARKKSEATEDMLYSAVQQTDKWEGVGEIEKSSAWCEKPRVESDKQFSSVDVSRTTAESSVKSTEQKPVEQKTQPDHIVKEIEQSYIDFQSQGWNAIAKLLNKKKAISNETEATQNVRPNSPEQTQQPSQSGTHKGKKDGDKVKGNDSEPEKMKRPKSGQNSKKQQRLGQVEITQKFLSAAEIVDFITKNFKDVGHGDHKSGWGDAKGNKENVDTHLRPLESFEFPAVKVEEIQKACADRRIYTPKIFK